MCINIYIKIKFNNFDFMLLKHILNYGIIKKKKKCLNHQYLGPINDFLSVS